jgi:MarR family transcriptional regulator for hemolysin
LLSNEPVANVIRYDFDESIGYLVCTTSLALQKALNDELRSQGITFRQWQVLACLALMGEEVSLADIADRLGLESATLVGVLDRMERDGWIRRVPCPNDRRKKWIQSTRQVIPVWDRMVECARRVRDRATDGIPAGDLKTAWRVLETVQSNLCAQPAVGNKA